MLRIASDERLVALTRAGNQGAFEVIVDRYQVRLLSFCTRIVGSREDAEDVLQEVFAASFNALLADTRAINLRPWLYRIARNRSLNHLRRHTAIGVDSMDVHFAEMGLSTSEKVFKRQDFQLLVGDIGQLPETQRTALLLREIDGLSYEQIALAMDQTVPGIKSLLVRARVGLGEASEARKLSCEDVRVELGSVAEGIASLSQPARRHLKGCERCSDFRGHLRSNNRALAALAPFGPLLLLKQLLAAKLGIGAGATAGGGAAASGGAAAAGGAAAVGGGTAGTVTATAVAAKAIAAIAAAAAVTAGAVAVAPVHRHVRRSAAAFAQAPVTLPQTMIAAAAAPAWHHAKLHHGAATQTLAASAVTVTSPTATSVSGITGVTGATITPNTEEVTTTTEFPGTAAGPTGISGSTSVSATAGAAATLPSTLTGTTSAVGATGASGSALGVTGASGSTGSTSGTSTVGASGASGVSAP
jgi:RNA polymerase sigma factor (sigma-70 family)